MNKKKERALILVEVISLVLIGFTTLGTQFVDNEINTYYLDLAFIQADLLGIENEMIHDSIMSLNFEIWKIKGNNNTIDEAGRNEEHYKAQWQKYKSIFNDKQTQYFAKLKSPPVCFGVYCQNLSNFLYLIQMILLFTSLIILLRIRSTRTI